MTGSNEPLSVVADDGAALVGHRWRGVGSARAAVIMVHGLCDHTARHADWLARLTSAGVDVYAFDLRGHGASTTDMDRGLVDARPVWRTLVADVGRIRRLAALKTGIVPVFLIGHGTGAAVVRAVARDHGRRYAGLILAGERLTGRVRGALDALISSIEVHRVETTGVSHWLERRSQQARRWRVPRHSTLAEDRDPLAWLTCCPRAREIYNDDPACGGALRLQTRAGVRAGRRQTNRPRARRMMPLDLPILLVSGRDDPLGGFGRAPSRLTRALINDGRRAIQLRLYDALRHDIFNDTLGADVVADLVEWLNARLDARPMRAPF